MEIKDVIELIKAVSDNGLTGFKIEQGDTKIVIKKEQPAVRAVLLRRRIRLYLTGLLPVLWWERFIPLRLRMPRTL